MGRHAFLILLVTAVVWTGCGTPEPAPPSPAVAPERPVLPTATTQRMARRLTKLADEADPIKSVLAGDMAPRIAAVRAARDRTTVPSERVRLTVLLADQMMAGGLNRETVAELEALEAWLAQPNVRVGVRTHNWVASKRATAWLRVGETANCLARHGPESCLLPIRGSGVHQVKDGSRQAIEVLGEVLGRDPDDVAARWLLNLAYMTLDEYPDGVPERWRIDPEVFASDGDVGRFENVASRAGVAVNLLSGGACTEDFDGDGLIDIISSSWGMRDQMRAFFNRGDGTFEDRTEESGLEGEVGGLNMIHADYDNDGWPDVLVMRGAWAGANGRHPNSLLRNRGDGTFTDVTEEAGLLSFHPTQAVAFVDYDGDGWLDIFAGNESTGDEIHSCELYRNQGDGTFRDVASDVGLDVVGFVKSAAWGDYNNDGRPDVYLSRLEQPNLLFRNDGPQPDGSWRFTDVTERAGVAEPLYSFPTWFFDYDNDGWLDLLVLSFRGFTAETLADVAADVLGLPTEAARPRLFHNQGDGTFRDVTVAMGVDDVLLAMGANYGDLDEDGWPDFYVGTGEPNLATLVPNRMYRNDGGRRFQDVTTSGGFGHLQKGHGIAFADLDNDGDQDVLAVMGGAYPADTAHDALFRNPGHGHHWVTLLAEGVRSNRSAIGARIRVRIATPAGERDVHAVVGTGGTFGSSTLRQEIGLGDATAIREIEVRWPATGLIQRFADVAPDRAYRVREGEPALIPVDLPRGSL